MGIDTERIKAEAQALGFNLVGITSLGEMETATHYMDWLDAGYAGEMGYLDRGAEKRMDSRLPFEGVSTAIVVGLNYGGHEPPGPVARYARGDDYHEIMWKRLDLLHLRVEEIAGRKIRGKSYVDTGPLLERDLGRRAGLGWFGKNTLLINPRMGSFFFLGSLVLDLDLKIDPPFTTELCGTCTRCLDACPTDALRSPRQLDSRLCISYLTIEKKGSIPEEMRDQIGAHLYGCDICQEVCPHVRKFSLPLNEPAFKPRPVIGDKDARTLAHDLLGMQQPEFSAAFKNSPMKRAKLRGLKRNAAVVLGNIGDPVEDIQKLEAYANHEADEMIVEHLKWAIDKLARRLPQTTD